jgi:hypothetical protein
MASSTPRETAPAHTASHRRRSGGTRGNELLTSAAAVVLIALLAAEGFTILDLRALVDEHMLVGLALIPPVVLKLGSVGYRFARYYGGAGAYVANGPPRLPLRLLAPVLVAATIALFASGVLMLAVGHRSRSLLQIHKLSAIVWAAVFAVHVIAYAPRVTRRVVTALRATRETAVPGGGARGLLITTVTAGGVALGLAFLPAIHGWHH